MPKLCNYKVSEWCPVGAMKIDDKIIELVAKALVDPDCKPLDHDGTPLWTHQIKRARAVIEVIEANGYWKDKTWIELRKVK
jgi:hypothetical protein